MGPFMVEIVFCRVTRRGRKKGKGMNKGLRGNMRNDGPAMSFVPPDDTIKITLDLSENGPVFSALDDMMMKMMDDDAADRKKNKGKGGAGGEAKDGLKRLLKSGIPGIEKMFTPPGGGGGGPGKKGGGKGFHKMNDGSKQKFMKAIFGEDGTSIDTSTAAALLAATCSGGDPEIGARLAELLVPEMDDKVDPTMMAALMSACSLINAGAGTEEVLKIMQKELKDSGMSEEDILKKTQLLMKSFGREESSSMAEYSLASKQKNSALKQCDISPKDFATVVMVQKAIAFCGSTPENFAKVMMIENQLSKRGAQSRHIADALKKLAGFDKRAEIVEKLKKTVVEEKLKKDDVFMNVRMCQALDNENEPTWKEVKSMKDILGGCSPNSPEGIELNLARATKSAGLKTDDLRAALTAQKTMHALGVDPVQMAKIMNIQKVIAENGVPSVEIARVLQDGSVPKEALEELATLAENAMNVDFKECDVDAFCKLYDNLRLKSNVPLEVIDHIDKTLIQVRCSLEDVADNLVCSQLARGEKEPNVVRSLCTTLHNTGASPEIVGTTMVGSLRKVIVKPECDIMKDVGRAMKEDAFETEDVTKAMTEVLLNLHEENPDLRDDLGKAMETVLKDCGGFPDQIRQLMDDVMEQLPEIERPMSPRLAAELERLKAEDDAREAAKRAGGGPGGDSSDDFIDTGDGQKKLKNPALAAVAGDSRRGSMAGSRLGSRRGSAAAGRSRAGSISLGGVERRGSYYGEDVSKRSTVAVVVDDPDGKKNMEKQLEAVFNGNGPVQNGTVAEQVVTVVGPSGQPMQVPVSAVLASQNINPEAMKTAVTNAVQNMDASQVVQIKDANGNTITIEKSILKARGIKVPANGQLPPDQLSSIMESSGLVTVVGDDGKTYVADQKTVVSNQAQQMVAQGGAVTVTGSDGKPMQIPQALVAQAQMGMVQPGPGATITVQGADGKPMQIPSNVLPMAQGPVTIAGSDGKPVVIPPALVAQAQLGQLKPGPDGTVTVQGSDGKPIKIPAATLAATATATAVPAGPVTIAGSDGKPVVIPPALVAQAQLGQLKPGPDGTVTVQGSDGKPMKIPATTLAATAAASVVPAGPVTIAGSDGNPVQIPQALVAQAQLGQLKPGPDGTITVQGADGKPIKIPAASLAAPAAAVHAGPVTIAGSDGQPLQIPQALIAQAQLGQLKPGPDGTITVPGADGKPMKIAAATLAATAAATNVPTGNIPITVTGADGKTVQVSAATLQAAQLSGQSGGMLTVQGPDGKPVQIPQNAAMQSLQHAQFNTNNTNIRGGSHQLANGQPASTFNPNNIRVTSGQIVEIYMSQQFEGAGDMLNGGDNQHLVDGILKSVQNLSSILDDVTFEGSPEEVKDQIRRRVGGANMTETDISKLLSVFDTPGVLSSHGGIAKFRTVSDMRDTINESDAAFNTAIDASRNRKIPGISEENRRLMQDILKKSAEDQDAMSNRVAALLAGTSLTTTAGTSVRRRDDIEEVGYETFGDVGTYKGRKDRFVPPVVRVTGPGTSPGPSRSTSTTRGPDPNHLDTTRPSIMRQSQSLSRLRKLTDKIKEDEKERKQRELERGEIRGLRRAKVPLMVYSCGGFTRCFRIARFYSTEGPPIGISYDRSTRAALNPELN